MLRWEWDNTLTDGSLTCEITRARKDDGKYLFSFCIERNLENGRVSKRMRPMDFALQHALLKKAERYIIDRQMEEKAKMKKSKRNA